MSKNSNLTANSVIKTYSNSFHSSKNQTPIKSPSPDHSHMNALTPTKVKYLIDQGKNVKAY
jgi:hypothetical protein